MFLIFSRKTDNESGSSSNPVQGNEAAGKYDHFCVQLHNDIQYHVRYILMMITFLLYFV